MDADTNEPMPAAEIIAGLNDLDADRRSFLNE